MARNRSVMKIFWRSSLILKTVTRLLFQKAFQAEARPRLPSAAVAMRVLPRLLRPCTATLKTIREKGKRRWAPASSPVRCVRVSYGPANRGARSNRLRLLRLHLVPDRLLRARDDFRGPALGRDL